jgi:hypothetical protein
MLPQRIKKNCCLARLVGALLTIISLTHPAFAAEEAITARSAVKFAVGVLSSAAVHETAHALVAAATGTSLTWMWIPSTRTTPSYEA